MIPLVSKVYIYNIYYIYKTILYKTTIHCFETFLASPFAKNLIEI